MKAQDTTHINMRAAGITMALAALVIAVLAVTLAAGPAQATTTTTDFANSGDDNSIPQGQEATHATPEPCAEGDDVARVVHSGHYALFDVWWNDEEGELTNNVCPPSCSVRSLTDEDAVTPVKVTRSPSSINITADPPTIIHIPNSAKVTLSESNYPKSKYKDVWDADDAENPDGDGDRVVWALPACPPKGPASNGLCISYSAALLNQADWTGDIEFIVTHVHQVDIDKQDRRYVLVYDVPEAGQRGTPVLRWYSADEETDKVNVTPGGYDRPMWFFPSRGAYEFQVYIRGNPDTDNSDPISKDLSVTSDLREYIIHVGAAADLSATMDATPQSASPGNNVSLEITASNGGPDTAPSTKVDVTLPEGLTYLSHSPSAFTFADGDADGVRTWDIGGLASGASMTLTVTARVDAETHGKTLTAKAVISATETVTTNSGTYQVPVPDSNPHNTAEDTVTVTSETVVAPIFMVERSVPESSAAGTNVGIPVLVKIPESTDTLTFTLSGDGHDNFTVEAVDGGAQIKVAANSYLNYEDTASPNSYDLTLQVSDGKDRNGNDDDSVDDTIAVRVAVHDVAESVGLTLTAAPTTQRANLDVRLDATLGSNPPAPQSQMRFIWLQRPLNGEIDSWRFEGNQYADNILVTSDSYGVMQYVAIGKYLDSTARVYKTVESAWVDVNYTR